MKTPIIDFVEKYIKNKPVRVHMPGHKGRGPYGRFSDIYKYDITEIDGADYLSAPGGIIAESEQNASRMFGCPTYYSAEGSSLCIRAMLFMIKKMAVQEGRKPRILAGRNAHSTFVNAAALLDIEVDWIMPLREESYESCTVTGQDIENYIPAADSIVDNLTEHTRKKCGYDALYVTSPDYLGNMLNISELAETCHRYGMLLLVDNAHGAYLKFLEQSLFPIDLGADMCSSSAHKTLPVLTGGAYLHISDRCRKIYTDSDIRKALSAFASTSPSYLILQSLDLCNEYLEKTAKQGKVYRLAAERVDKIKKSLGYFVIPNVYDESLKVNNHDKKLGLAIIGNEPIKLTIMFSGILDGNKVAEDLAEHNIYVEYHDKDHIVFMFSPMNTEEDYKAVEDELLSIIKCASSNEQMKDSVSPCAELRTKAKKETGKATVYDEPNMSSRFPDPERVMSPKEAMMAPSEAVMVKDSIGRILASPVLTCPPCVPLYMCGEVIGENISDYYSGEIMVVKQI